jgi:hypothetical protein
MRSHRIIAWLVGLALVVAACGGGATDVATPDGNQSAAQGGDATPTTAVASTEPAATPVTEESDDTAPSPDARPAPDPNREIAPDFSLLLGDGSTFVLSEETRPVFMVFWAEW